MTTRELKIIKAILDELHEADGAQLNEVVLHAKVNERLGETVSLGEMNAMLAIVDVRGWATVVPQKHKRGKLRASNEAGEGARLEL